MQATLKRITLSAALLCAIAPTALALRAQQALGAQPSTGAAAAPANALSPNRSESSFQAGAALATWFGPGLFGNQTACGQVLTRRLVGVANRTLPCGTLVKVSFEGRALTVPVVDRGPYGPLHASWDLTQAAARMLHMAETSRVEATIVGHVTNSPQLGAPTAYSSRSDKTATALSKSGGAAAA